MAHPRRWLLGVVCSLFGLLAVTGIAALPLGSGLRDRRSLRALVGERRRGGVEPGRRDVHDTVRVVLGIDHMAALKQESYFGRGWAPTQAEIRRMVVK